ncbi:hypothetical protein L249_7719 [Ophiocordyceps polyrhachis-furcata BCC 54312]|uniref:SET domain-containing protein n=1 Tax=Ophiocordyceps polyrhachis-furcata BCC 54312 TaxID=1330021 RepID=A0A367LAS2_9HYPO|nr:hypothetical protein L249_7719 [Ophiocordyceps polyrhachis-furcata BCC 54312]
MPPKRKRSLEAPAPARRSARKSAAVKPDDAGLTEMKRRKPRLAVQNPDLIPPVVDKKPRQRTRKSQPSPPPPSLVEAQAEVDVQMEDAAPEKGARRPPPINSERLPLPWTGRLGYACLNTYLRFANPPVFCSRTCRLSSIIDHRHPLTDPTQTEHATKNRPDKTKPPDVARGLAFVQSLGLANAADIGKMLRWNDKYGINFMRLSSEMFPFASHKEHGYKLAPFASEVLADAGRVAAELGHRLTTHPGQYTQIGSPRPDVVTAAVRDLEYHDEMLSLLSLPGQLNRDAVMILHMGGMYGDKGATLDRFRQNYAKLSDGVKRRLVLENDDVVWSVHDLLPVCEELNIPLVLDFHHHNIVFDPVMREGTQDVISLFDRIKATWTRKGITQKMHYSESVAGAVTSRNRRKHSARVKTLPPCANDMDLMIEAKDKEQAVFELMRTFKLPGWHLFNDVVPYERDDEPRKAVLKKKIKKGKKAGGDDEVEVIAPEREVSPESVSMGGPENRVYWPEGMEEWLRPKKREVKKGVARRDIPAGTVLCTIPRKAILSIETSDLGHRLRELSSHLDDRQTPPLTDLDSWSGLILVLIYEHLLGPDSRWEPYLHLLPESFDTPMFWSEEELAELQASALPSKIGRREADDMFRDLILPVIRARPSVFRSSEGYSDEMLLRLAHRMGSTVMAYAFDLGGDDDEDDDEAAQDGWVEDRDEKMLMGMVPVADMLNADAEFNVCSTHLFPLTNNNDQLTPSNTKAHVNHQDHHLTITSLRPIKAGEEILNYYGPHPNSELLRRYGYVTAKHARYDVVEIPWSAVEEATAAHLSLSRHQLDKARDGIDPEELEDTFVLERESGEPKSDGTLDGPASVSELPADLLHQLDALLKAAPKSDKRGRDEAQTAILARVLTAIESGYPTSIAEDELLLQRDGLEARRRMAVLVRLGEKRVIDEAKSFLSDAAPRRFKKVKAGQDDQDAV